MHFLKFGVIFTIIGITLGLVGIFYFIYQNITESFQSVETIVVLKQEIAPATYDIETLRKSIEAIEKKTRPICNYRLDCSK